MYDEVDCIIAENRVHDLRQQVNELKEQMRWRKVSEESPEEEGKKYETIRINPGGWWTIQEATWRNGNWNILNIDFWRPLELPVDDPATYHNK